MRRVHPFPRRGTGAMLVACALWSAGCNDANLGVSADGGARTGELSVSINEANAPFVILDLASGDRRTATTLDDLAGNSAYRSGQMVFRRVNDQGSTFLLGVFEVTQSQWQVLAPASPQPWELVDAALVGGAGLGGTLPAFNLSDDYIVTALAAYNVGKVVQLQVPSEAQWESACAGGGSGAWSWGAASDRTTFATHARVAETSSAGPQVVGTLAANAFGFFDMHGNVWEWAGTGAGARLRGGSWHDAAVLARTANALGTAQGVYSDTRHALAGVRLLLRQ